MSGPYDQNPGGPQNPADPAAPTQYVPVQGQQPQFGQAPQFGAPVPPQQQAQFGPPAPQPQFGPPQPQPQPQQDAPAWGQAPQQFGTQPTQPYPNPYQQYPAQPAKKQRGRGAAGILGIAFGTALGRLVLVLLIGGGIAAYHFATADPAQRNSNGQVSQSGNMDATDLKVGDCFDAPSATSGISTIKAIPCSQAHDSQVYAEPQITESSYPGDSTLQTEAKNDCGSSSAQSVISSSAPSSAGIADYFPQDATTFADQSYIICALESDSQTMTQSYVSTASSAS